MACTSLNNITVKVLIIIIIAINLSLNLFLESVHRNKENKGDINSWLPQK